MDELIKNIVEQLGISEGQAKGGSGLIFKLLKKKLSEGDFSQISQMLGGGLDDLISGAPSDKGLGSVAGMLTGLLGKGKGIGALASLIGGFSKLKLDSDMIGNFGNIIFNFIKGRNENFATNVLQNLLKG